MKYLVLLLLLASCGSKDKDKESTQLQLQCVSNNEGITCYGENIKCYQEYFEYGAMVCTVWTENLGAK